LAAAFDRKYKVWHLAKGIETYFTQLDNTTNRLELHVPMLVPTNLGIAYRNKIADIIPTQLPDVSASLTISEHAPALARTGIIEDPKTAGQTPTDDAETSAEDQAS